MALTIPFSLLFASILLDLRHIPANLLSLGALDFGMVVDGSVVMVENILRRISERNGKDEPLTETVRLAAQEVQQPVFYAIAIIITAYLPIFTLEHVEGRLFHPMAWTVAFALLGAILFAILIAPVLASLLFRPDTVEWRNPVLEWVTELYRRSLDWSIRHHRATLAGALVILFATAALIFGGFIGSEFLPHLDEGAIWARGTLAPSTGPSEGIRIMNQARIAFAKFPEVKTVVSQVGRPDDGTDATGFFNTEYFLDLKPHNRWRSQFHQNKELLITALEDEVEKIPGVIWNFSQPISDNMEEAVSGVKGEMAVKIIGPDLKTLESKADEIVGAMSPVPGIADLGTFRVLGQPNLDLTIDRSKADRLPLTSATFRTRLKPPWAASQMSRNPDRRGALRSGGPLSGALSLDGGGHRQHPHPGTFRRARLHRATLRRQD